MPPNNSVEARPNGRPRSTALVFSAPRGLPSVPPHLERWASEELAARAPARNSPTWHLTPDRQFAGPRHLVGAGAKAPANHNSDERSHRLRN